MSGENIGARLFDTLRIRSEGTAILAKRDGFYRGISCREMMEKVGKFSAGLRAIGLGKGDRVALLSENRPEWAYADFGALLFGAVTVPIYTTNTPRQIGELLEHSSARALIVEKSARVQNLAPHLGKARELTKVIVMDPSGPAPGTMPDLLSFEDVMDLGAASGGPSVDELMNAVKPHDLASIVYTAGTFGDPKGARLTHRNFLAQMESLKEIFPFRPGDITMSFLPLSHILQRVVDLKTFLSGATVAYAERIETMWRNMQEVRPTVLVGVPRTFAKIRSIILDELHSSSFIRRRSFQWARNVEISQTRQKSGKKPSPILQGQQMIAKHIFLEKARREMGGRIRHWRCSGAALPRGLAEFFYGMGITIIEGYGMTELCGAATSNYPDRYRFGTVGLTMPGIEGRTADDGEILVRGGTVMDRYHGDDDSIIDTDGWLHTGDVGKFDADGFLTITARKKAILVTASGKNVAPMPIEMALQIRPYIARAIAVGDDRPYLTALIVPDFRALEIYAQENNIIYDSYEDLLGKDRVVHLFDGIVKEVNADLARFETIKKYRLIPRELSLENMELTPTLKLRRSVITQHFRGEIDSMY